EEWGVRRRGGNWRGRRGAGGACGRGGGGRQGRLGSLLARGLSLVARGGSRRLAQVRYGRGLVPGLERGQGGERELWPGPALALFRSRRLRVDRAVVLPGDAGALLAALRERVLLQQLVERQAHVRSGLAPGPVALGRRRVIERPQHQCHVPLFVEVLLVGRDVLGREFDAAWLLAGVPSG